MLLAGLNARPASPATQPPNGRRRELPVTTSGQVPPPLRVEEGQDGVLTVSGELDLASAPQLGTVLDRHIGSTAQDVVLDLSDLQFCDSTGLSVFVVAHRTLRGQDRRLVLHQPSSRVRKLLATTKLDQELEID